MGIVTSVIFVGSISSPEILARMYARRGVVMAVLGVLNVLSAITLPELARHTWAFDALIACGVATLAASACCFKVSMSRGEEAVKFAMLTFGAFATRSAFYLAIDGSNLANGYLESTGYIFLVLQVALSAAYLYFTFVGWQKWKGFTDGSGAPLAGGNV